MVEFKANDAHGDEMEGFQNVFFEKNNDDKSKAGGKNDFLLVLMEERMVQMSYSTNWNLEHQKRAIL